MVKANHALSNSALATLEESAPDLELSRTRHLSTFEPCKRTNTYGYTVLKQLCWYGLNLNVQLSLTNP